MAHHAARPAAQRKYWAGSSPSSQGRVPALKRSPPGELAKARAVQLSTRRHCNRRSPVLAASERLTVMSHVLASRAVTAVSLVCRLLLMLQFWEHGVTPPCQFSGIYVTDE